MREDFKFRKVLRLPAEAVRWQADARAIMAASSVARGLSSQEVEDIVDFYNSSWGDPGNTIRYCVVGVCRHNCQGRRGVSCRNAEKYSYNAVARSGIPIALEYRRKNMEQANGKALRGKAMYDCR